MISGVYERFFEENEENYHHIFSPASGYPAKNGLLSVTVTTDIQQNFGSMDADALSTAIFVLGYEKGMALLENFPGADVIFVFEDKSFLTTPGVNFIVTDRTFYVKEQIQ